MGGRVLRFLCVILEFRGSVSRCTVRLSCVCLKRPFNLSLTFPRMVANQREDGFGTVTYKDLSAF